MSLSYLILFVLVVLVLRILRIGRRPKGYPPGPPTIPILGNYHLFPHKDVHLQFQKWAKQYGPIYSIILGTKTLVVLSSANAVKDLLDKKSGIYSDRQEMYVGQTLCSGDLRMLMMGYTPTWRYQRRMVHSLLNINSAKSYVPYQMLENKQMLHEMLTQPHLFLENIRRYSNALTTTMVFGWRSPEYENEHLKQLFEGFNEMATISQTGAATLIDLFPFLRNLPDFLLPAKKTAKDLHKREKNLYMTHWLNAKRAYSEGTIKPCFCVGMAEAQKVDGFSDDQAAYISGTLLEAGSDTTSSTLYGFIQAMLLFPDVQRKAQAEIDRICPNRLPTMDDEPHLQYIRGCVKESLRWMPTTILGAVPHAVSQDDWYMGYLIPKGAAVMNNVYTLNMDPERYPAPRQFSPDRYKDDFKSVADSASDPDGTKRDQFTFGAGRRICPGMHVAERSLFLGISRMLAAFDIRPELDEKGRPILPDPDNLTQGFVCMPQRFRARITPRSKERAEMVKMEWSEAEKDHLHPVTKQWVDDPVGALQSRKT
ncbi:hypothetical protein LTS15_003777 [Exophiala xenobiotica]|nr:hypothetical protein LTS15_003777 [Exophiala xenobiotica]